MKRNIKMTKKNPVTRTSMATCLAAFAFMTLPAAAQSQQSSGDKETKSSTAKESKNEATASRHVNDAVAVVKKMEAEPGMDKLLTQAKGVFIVPTYGRGAVGVGGSGGSGVLLVKRGDNWSDPAFYNIGSIGVGAQLGAEAGSIAMVLNNDKAVNSFMKQNNFSLSADAGLTVVDWAKMAQGSVGEGDVVVWSGTKGLFGDVASISVNDVRFNRNLTNAYYNETVSAKDVIAGKAKNSKSDELKQALAATGGGATSGASSDTGPSKSGSSSK
jgi:lipid-binding SYLF domain-containing protein